MTTCLASVMLLASALFGGDLSEDAGELIRGEDSWAWRRRHPALVNQVGAADDGSVLSLRGTWRYLAGTKDRKGPKRNSTGRSHGNPMYYWSDSYVRRFGGEREMEMPGCWESKGLRELGMSEPWRASWDSASHEMNVFHGQVWFRKDVTVPKDWHGRRIWLKVGGVNSVGWFWVNDRPVAHVSSYCGTYKWEITDLVGNDGKVKLVAEISNIEPSRKGNCNSRNHFGGILRDVELEATPTCFIDDAWVRGDFDKRCAEVRIEMGGEGGRKVRATIEGETVERAIEQSNNPTILTVPLRNFRAWSPEHPNLYWAKIELIEGGKVVQTRRERFGVRKLEVRGKEFYLNDKPFYFRGAGWHVIDPINGAVPADREHLRGIIRKIRASGFNFVRFHTHCKSPECFEVADEEGLMIQPELPYYNDIPTDPFLFDPIGDALELYRHYRRYPSFAVYSGGNEGSFGPALSAAIYRVMKKTDPDRLYYGQDDFNMVFPYQPVYQGNREGTSDIYGGPTTEWIRGSFDPARPFICHEYCNVTVKLDSRLESRFTGVWVPPQTRASRAAWLGKFGLDMSVGDRLQDAQHALQKFWIKHIVESARADPFCDGYSFWSLQDACHPNGPAFSAQGLFNPFWEEKPEGLTAAGMRVFNDASCVILDLARGWNADTNVWKGAARHQMFPADTNYVFRSGETMPLKFLFQHYGETPAEDAELAWSFVSEGRILASGRHALGNQAIGPTRQVAAQNLVVPPVPRACKATLGVSIRANGGVEIARNGWDFWFFPSETPTVASVRAAAARAGIVVAAAGSAEARAAIAAGRRLVTLTKQTGPANIFLGWWWMGSQVGMVVNDHPALGAFPHDGVLTPVFFRIVKEGLKLPIDGVSQKDLIIVGEGRDDCYGYLAERRHPTGAREMIVAGLDLTTETPEGATLLKGIVDSLKGEERLE